LRLPGVGQIGGIIFFIVIRELERMPVIVVWSFPRVSAEYRKSDASDVVHGIRLVKLGFMRARRYFKYPFAVAEPLLSGNTDTCGEVHIRPTVDRRLPVTLSVRMIERIGVLGDFVNLKQEWRLRNHVSQDSKGHAW
jgi:hypothetical protein